MHYLEDKRVFGDAETGVVAYDDPQLLTAAGLARLERLDARLRKVEGVQDVLSLAEAALPSAPLDGRSLREHLQQQNISVEEFRAEMLACSLYRDRLLSSDGRTAVLVVTLAPPGETEVSRADTLEEIRGICDAHDLPAVLAGASVLVSEIYRHLEQDGRTLGIASSLVLAVVIALLFRNLRWIVLPLAVVHLTLVCTKASLVLGGMRLSMVSSPLTALVTVIGVATVVHVAIRFREERGARAPEDALRHTLIHVGPAIFWTCVTTAAGFSSLLISQIAPTRGFGTMMAIGSLLVFASAVGLVPGGTLLGRFHTDPARAPGEGKLSAALGGIVTGVERYPWRVACLGAVLLGVTSLGMLRLQVATDFNENFRQSSPIVASYNFLAERLGTAAMLDVLVDIPDADVPDNDVPDDEQAGYDDFLEELGRLQRELERQPGVVGTLSAVDVQDFMTGTKPGRVGVLGQLMAASVQDFTPAERLELLRLLKPDTLAGFWNQDRRVTRIMVQLGPTPGAEAKRRQVEAIEATARKRFPGARTAGVDVLLTYLVQSLLGDQWVTFGLAVTAILVMLSVAFRDWRLGLIALVPNAAPILMVVGAMGWLGLKVNVATAMLASVSMGLAVDFSIHYLYRFRHELRAGKSFEAALREAHGSVGLAMVLANIALVAGFSALTISAFVPTVHFGILVSVAMLGGLAGNLIALPLMLRLLPGFGRS